MTGREKIWTSKRKLMEKLENIKKTKRIFGEERKVLRGMKMKS